MESIFLSSLVKLKFLVSQINLLSLFKFKVLTLYFLISGTVFFFIFNKFYVKICIYSVTGQEVPPECARGSGIQQLEADGRSICYVKLDYPHSLARRYCESKGWKLLDLETSLGAKLASSNFAKNLFGFSPRAVVYVNGRRGNRCSVLTGSGRRSLNSCHNSNHFLCEYPSKTSNFQQKTYQSFFFFWTAAFCGNASTSAFVPTATACYMERQAIKAPNVPFSLFSSTHTVDNITMVDARNNRAMEYLPLGMNALPNLKLMFFWKTGVKELTYEPLKGLTQLEFLDMRDSYIETISADAATDLDSLVSLFLSKFHQNLDENCFLFANLTFFRKQWIIVWERLEEDFLTLCQPLSVISLSGTMFAQVHNAPA